MDGFISRTTKCLRENKGSPPPSNSAAHKGPITVNGKKMVDIKKYVTMY